MSLRTSRGCVSEGSRKNAFEASKGRAFHSPEVLRKARESRYSRDQEALSASLTSCSLEPSVVQLQVAALERVKIGLETRIKELQLRLNDLRARLVSQTVEGDQSHESLLRQRLVVEHGIAAASEEVTAVIKEIEELNLGLRSSMTDSNSSVSCGSTSRARANLSLFLQNSPTQRPFPKALRPLSADHIHRYRTPRSRRSARHFRDAKATTHLWSRSFVGDYHMDNSQANAGRAIMSSSSFGLQNENHPEASLTSTCQSVPAVDEFSNSFSARVIEPSRSRSKPRSSLRPLHTASRVRRSIFNGQRISRADSTDYGNVTLFPSAAPRSKSELLADLSSTPLPSYVQSLISSFEQVSSSPLVLSFMKKDAQDTSRPALLKGAPLTPLLEQPSLISSVHEKQPTKDQTSSKSTGRKLVKKHRSIFTLRLPLRPTVPGSPSHSTLAASSSTSVSEWRNEQLPVMSLVDSTVPVRPKGLPSTRDYDLAMLERAPDDIPETPVSQGPATPVTIKSRSSRPLAVLRGVKSKFIQLGRH